MDHPVLHSNKTDKVPIVFEFATIHVFISLNNQILQEVNLTIRLLGVLLLFQRRLVALTADTEVMFHQIKLCPKHRNAWRFFCGTAVTYHKRPCLTE